MLIRDRHFSDSHGEGMSRSITLLANIWNTSGSCSATMFNCFLRRLKKAHTLKVSEFRAKLRQLNP